MAAPSPAQGPFQITVELLLNEAELALLALARMLTDDDRSASAFVLSDVKATYQSVRATRSQLTLSAREAAALDAKMDRLRATLRFLGERV